MTKKSDNTIAAAILAGGKAHRLGGIAKGNIKCGNGVSIIAHIIKELKKAGIDNIVISANDTEPYRNCGVKIISDIRAGMGPMGGIESGLVHFAGKSDAVMFVPCDMPNITAKELLVLKEAFMETKAPVVFAETTDFFWHPLCSVVHNDVIKEISYAIDGGCFKIRDIWKKVEAVPVLFTDKEAFLNINDQTDLERWQRRQI